eukprot:m.58161 g.58161  ORF g.58161 m.58161 type:complete len:382 (-) comp22510_c0_seq2:24-1169(-)
MEFEAPIEAPVHKDPILAGAVGGPPVDVVTSVQWIAITAVHTMRQTFEAEIDISLTVRNGINVVDKSFLGPKIKITNGVGLSVIHDTSTQPARRGDDLSYQYHVRGEFSQKFELHQFPLDIQELQIRFQPQFAVLVPGTSAFFSKQLCRFVLSDTNDPVPVTLVKEGVTIAPLLYHVREVNIQVGHTPKIESKRGNIYSCVSSAVVVQRRGGFYYWNIMFPSFLFTSMEFLALMIATEDLADRLSVTITLLLTLAAYKIVSASAVPDIPYLTLLDIYVVACAIFSALLAVQHGIASVVMLDTNFDLISGLSVFGLWLMFNLYMVRLWKHARTTSLGTRKFVFEHERGNYYRKKKPHKENEEADEQCAVSICVSLDMRLIFL